MLTNELKVDQVPATVHFLPELTISLALAVEDTEKQRGCQLSHRAVEAPAALGGRAELVLCLFLTLSSHCCLVSLPSFTS